MSKSWFEVSPQGLRKTLSQKDKFFLITETVSNAWDAEGCTRVDITLTKPDEQGFSWLTATDNAPKGFTDISHSYMMYAESEKKDKANKRGRFNAGEKDVIAMSVEARLTTVSGQILFNGDGTRTEGTEKRTVGSELTAKIPLTLEEYEHVIAQAHRLIPPNNIATYVNGQHVASRRAAGVFEDTLPTPLSDREGFVRNVDRPCKVKLHNPLPGEQSYIYEMGIPIVELGDDCWHVDVQQKVPLSRDRDNVNPAYLRKVRAAVLNAMVDKLTPEETELGWVEAAAGAPEAKDGTIKTMLGTRFGNREMVLPVKSDPGATREAQSQGAVVLDRALTGDLRKRVKELRNQDGSAFVAPADVKYATNGAGDVSGEIPMQQWSRSTREYVSFVERVAPALIDQRIRVKVIDNDATNMVGCLKWQSGIMLVNLALHNTEDWTANFDLFIHEMAHADVHNNDHLSHRFYNTVSEVGAKLAQLAIERPDLFKEQKGAAVANSFTRTRRFERSRRRSSSGGNDEPQTENHRNRCCPIRQPGARSSAPMRPVVQEVEHSGVANHKSNDGNGSDPATGNQTNPASRDQNVRDGRGRRPEAPLAASRLQDTPTRDAHGHLNIGISPAGKSGSRELFVTARLYCTIRCPFRHPLTRIIGLAAVGTRSDGQIAF